MLNVPQKRQLRGKTIYQARDSSRASAQRQALIISIG
jgi:hypothetical protein